MQVAQLRQQNRALRQRIADFKKQKQLGPGLKNEIQKFVSESKKNLAEMNERSMAEQQKSNKKLHELTQKYETVLKEQISQLTNNKNLSQKKQALEKRTNDQVQKLTKEYEEQISDFEKKVKVNVKKIQQMGSSNIIKRLIKNEKFKKAMAERGCDLSGLEKQSELEEIAEQVEQQQKLIQAAETKSATLDEELEKMQELIETMKELMENMQKEKQNILKQNNILKEKLEQSEELIGKLLGNNPDGQEDPAQDGEDQK